MTYDRRNRLPRTATATAGGIGTITYDPVPSGYEWHVERITVFNGGAAAPVVGIYHDSVDPVNLLDYTLAGNADVALELPPLVLFSGEQLVVQFTGCTALSVCTSVIQYIIMGGSEMDAPTGSPEGRS